MECDRNFHFELILSLSRYRSDSEFFAQDAIGNTGFNGWLSLELVDASGLELKSCHNST
jgi:hypothetical protein